MPKNTGLFPGGTTSVHAENTGIQLRVRDHARNYLRVCGEYSYFHLMRCPSSELPPRARRILGVANGG